MHKYLKISMASISPTDQKSKSKYFKKTVNDQRPGLSLKEQKWCRCILHVAAKQSKECLKDVKNNAGKILEGKKCYNPYAVCSKVIGTSSRNCDMYYNFRHIPTHELIAYAYLKNIEIPKPFSRNILIYRLVEQVKFKL